MTKSLFESEKELLSDIKDLLQREIHRGWEEDAVRAWNDFCESFERWGEKVLDDGGKEFYDILASDLEVWGWYRVKEILARLDDKTDWVQFNEHGNAVAVDADGLLAKLKEAKSKLEEYLKDVD